MWKIVKITPLEKKISFIIHLNNICNFKCDYCTAGQQTSSEKLNDEQIWDIIDSIQKVRDSWDNRPILVDLTGWEPTLDNNLIKIIKLFLTIEHLELQITTNLFRLWYFETDLRTLKNTNQDKLNFNISYHYFESKGKEDVFIQGINILKANNINFEIKFLLPDNNTRLDDFVEVKNKILVESKLWEDFFKYDLIINSNGKVSDTYSDDILDYFYNKWYQKSNVNNNLIWDKIEWEQNKWLEVVFDDGQIEQLDFSDIRTRGINKFKWLNCFYISKESIEISISHKWYATFWPCFTLDKLRYNISDLVNLISTEKKIICPDEYCDCGINLKKEKWIQYEKMLKIETVISSYITKYLSSFEIVDIAVSLWKHIKITLKLDELFVYFYIEKDIWENYIIKKDWIWYYISIKNQQNILLSIYNINWEYNKNINSAIVLLSKLDNIYKTLLLKNEV